LTAKRRADKCRPSKPPAHGSRRGDFAGQALLIPLVLSALALRAVLALGNRFPSVDGVFYMDQARRLLTGGELIFSTFPPGWPLLFTGPLFLLGVDDPIAPLRAAQLVNVVLGTAFGGLVWSVLRPEAGRWIATAGAAVALFLPRLIMASTGDMSDVTYACVIAVCWLLDHRGASLATGLLLGYAYLIRPEALLIAAGLAVLHLVEERRVPWRLLLGFAVLSLPYVLFIHAETGRWSLSSKAVVLDRTLREHPGAAYQSMILDNLRLHLFNLVRLLGLPLVALALTGAVTRPGRWLLYLVPGLLPPLFSIAMVPRFWLPMVPFVLLGAVLGGRWLLSRLFARRRSLGAAALAALAATGVLVASLDDIPEIGRVHEEYAGLRDAGLMLRMHVGPDTQIAAYKPYASFWAGCRHLRVPADMKAGDVVAYCREKGADYLVVNVYIALHFRPGLLDLLESPLPADLRSEVTLVKVFKYPHRDGDNTAVYRIEPRP